MKHRIRIAFFDVDWTLYDHKNDCWSKASIEAIKSIQKRGIKVFICSARPFHSLNALGAFGLGFSWDGYISSAGACAFADNKFIRKTLMEPQRVKEFLALVQKEGLSAEVIEPVSRKLIFPLTEDIKEHYRRFKEVIPPLAPYEGEEVTGINLFAPVDKDPLFASAFPDFVFYRFAPMANDVSGEPHRKGDGIESVLNYYGLKKEEAIAFGDDYQDLSMFEEVGTFVAMNNGVSELKKVAAYVCKDVWDDGVYEGLKHFGLLTE